MANSLNRITPTEDVMPLIRATGMNRQQLVDALANEGGLKQGMRYFALQAAINRDATLWADAQGLKPGADGWAEAVRTKAQNISATLKGNEIAKEAAISSASPIDILHQYQYQFGDQPEMLARRGQGQAVLKNWADATTAIKDVVPGGGLDTKVVDEAGAPIRVYHGTDKVFGEFAPQAKSHYPGEDPSVYHFTEDPDLAALHAMGPMPSFKNPPTSNIH